MDYERMTAPCGLDCFNCLMYAAVTNAGLREKIAERLHIQVEKAMCRGCRDEGGTIVFLGMKSPCNVYACASEKGLNFCSECPGFPCDHLHPYADKASLLPHNTKVFNLCLIKRMGLEKWAEEKAKSVKDTYFKAKFKL